MVWDWGGGGNNNDPYQLSIAFLLRHWLNFIVTNRPNLPGKVPLTRPCPASRPTERSFNGLSRRLPSRAELECLVSNYHDRKEEILCSGQLLLQVRVSISFGSKLA